VTLAAAEIGAVVASALASCLVSVAYAGLLDASADPNMSAGSASRICGFGMEVISSGNGALARSSGLRDNDPATIHAAATVAVPAIIAAALADPSATAAPPYTVRRLLLLAIRALKGATPR
jgi:hypothetical protein